MSDYVSVGCLNCLACWDWRKDGQPDPKCPSCGVVTAEYNHGERKLKWTSVVRLFSDQAQAQSFHEQHHKEHEKGCRVCRGRRARQLAPMLNTLMREQNIDGARRLILKNKEVATLAVSYAREEYRHMLESIVRQEFGIDLKPVHTEQ